MLMRALSVLVLSILTVIIVGGCSHNDDVRGGMMSDSRDTERDQSARRDDAVRDGGDDDVQVALADCPSAVQATIAKYLDGGAINEIERSPTGTFEVEVNGANSQFEFAVAGDGTYLGAEDDNDDDDDDDDGDDDDR